MTGQNVGIQRIIGQFSMLKVSLTSRYVNHFHVMMNQLYFDCARFGASLFSMISSGRLSSKVSNYYGNCGLVGKWRCFCSKILQVFFQSRKLSSWFENFLAIARSMGKKKAKEPETPAKDEVSSLA